LGTSISHHSLSTNSWRAVAATYKSQSITTERVVQEIWRAATNQPSGNLKADLCAPIIARCLEVTLEAKSPTEAYHNTSKMIALSGPSTLATDMAKRAAVNSFLKPENRRLSFAGSLFSEAVNYLIARDLSGYVGRGDRIKNVSDAILFKKSIREQVEAIVSKHAIPSGVEREYDKWKAYVESVVSTLTGRQ
jgi:hypothetical protein